MNKTRKSYGNRIAKQLLAEHYFKEGNKNNKEIAQLITFDTNSETSEKYISLARTRYKKKLEELQANAIKIKSKISTTKKRYIEKSFQQNLL